MLRIPGFSQHSLNTSLGKMVYYTADRAPWLREEVPEKSLPTLVFLHGFGGGSSAYEWSKVYPAFASEYRILAPDLIGWGSSDHLDRDYLIDDYLTSIAEFLEKSCDEPTTVIASSLTAAFTIRVAIASAEEERHSVAPLKLFSLFDPSEPLFDCWGWHPAIVYRRVHLFFGHPLWIDEAQR